MLDKTDKGMIGGLTGFVLSLFLVLYHEIQQNQETLRRIELKLDHLNHRKSGAGVKLAEEAENGKSVQNER